MQGTRLSIWPSAVRGYRDAWRALLAMPALAGAAFVIGLAEKWAFQSLSTLPLELDVSRRLVAAARDVQPGGAVGTEHAEGVHAFGRKADPPVRRRRGDEEHLLRADESDVALQERVVNRPLDEL